MTVRSDNSELNYITDSVGAGSYGSDIDNQSSGNYSYDANGNISGTRWYNKVPGTDSLLGYLFGYDNAQRLTSATTNTNIQAHRTIGLEPTSTRNRRLPMMPTAIS